MFDFKKEITICANKKYAIDIQEGVKDIKIYGAEHIYLNDDMVFDTIVTKYTAEKVANVLKNKLYKCRTKNIGNVVFVDFY